MDEILIEDKKYVSSKRAAKMTGYAKDYVGQLCREGRVPARLVGRSWYVLETAIQDHRFPASPAQGLPKEKEKGLPKRSWESPRYEAVTSEVLPSVNRLREEAPKHLQESWRAWFNNFDIAANTEPEIMNALPEKPEEENNKTEEQYEEPEEGQKIETEEGVPIPIRTIYQLPPEELLPRRTIEEQEYEPELYVNKRPRLHRGIMRTIQVAGIALAAFTTSAAVIGSGYFDEYIISSSQGRIIAGVVLYNK